MNSIKVDSCHTIRQGGDSIGLRSKLVSSLLTDRLLLFPAPHKWITDKVIGAQVAPSWLSASSNFLRQKGLAVIAVDKCREHRRLTSSSSRRFAPGTKWLIKCENPRRFQRSSRRRYREVKIARIKRSASSSAEFARAVAGRTAISAGGRRPAPAEPIQPTGRTGRIFWRIAAHWLHMRSPR